MARQVMSALGLVFGLVTAGWAEEADPAGEAGTVSAWTKQLNADAYDLRDAATQELIRRGAAAVGPVAAAVRSGGWETTTRGIYVLQELSLSRDMATEQAALSALEDLAARRDTPQSRRAAESLTKLVHLRRQRAEQTFTQLGAVLDRNHVESDVYQGYLYQLEIGPEWRGEETDLRRLKWLNDVEQVTLVGPQVSDAWLPHLRGMEKLLVLKIKRAGITDAGLAELKDFAALRCVKLLYLPIGDQAAGYLAECRQLMRLKIIGTDVTPMAHRALSEIFGVDNVDCRRGAFLGIKPSSAGESWMINAVTENSAAAQAGLLPGDVIIRYGDHRVPDFETLTRLIAQNNVGDTIRIQILRNGKTFEKDVTFGEWE